MQVTRALLACVSKLSREVDCVFVDIDGGRWSVAELDFADGRVWIRARPLRPRRETTSTPPLRVFDAEVKPGAYMDFLVGESATLRLKRPSGNEGLRLTRLGRSDRGERPDRSLLRGLVG